MERLPTLFFALFMGTLTTATQAAQPSPSTPTEKETSNLQLERVVIVSRHGVRSPTQPVTDFTPFSDKPWPTWPVGIGEITPRGMEGVTQMGRFYGQYFRQLHLLPTAGCPAPDQIYVWADTDQRTIMTGKAFADGIAQNCHIPIHHQDNLHKPDPLFHPITAGVCTLDIPTAKHAVETALGGQLDNSLNKKYKDELHTMSEILNFKHSSWRAHQDNKKEKSGDFSDFEANRFVTSSKSTALGLSGPVDLSSLFAETFLLQYAEGMPEVGWGRITSTHTWQSLLTLRNAKMDLIYRTPYLARHGGTPLMHVLHSALSAATGKNVTSRLLLPKNNRILFLAAHDTTIANIAGMLGISWTLPDQPDNTPPAGGLVFELWKDTLSQHYQVKIQMVYQTMEQLRTQRPLDITDNPASQLTLTLTGCQEGFCNWEKVSTLMQNSLIPSCL